MNVGPHFDPIERINIIQDYMCWKLEAEEGKMTDDEALEEIKKLREVDDETLLEIWETNVGEWVLSRNLHHPATVDAEEFLRYQFGLMLDGMETDYGFIEHIDVPAFEARMEEN